MRERRDSSIPASVLGFGCGSVQGRVGREASLKAMNTAWEQGITLFDVARSYGFGEAESILGEFMLGKRDQVEVSTKFGIVPQSLSGLKRLAVPLARVGIGLPGINRLRRQAPRRPTQYGTFTVEVLRDSLETSLRKLRTDRVDLLFLHEANADAMRQDDLMAELGALVKAGKVLRAGLYAKAHVIDAALSSGPTTLDVMQFGADVFDPVVSGFAARKGEKFLIANHPFGGRERLARTNAVLKAIACDPTMSVELREKLGKRDWPMVLAVIFGVILGRRGADAVILSMIQPEHIRANVRAVRSGRFSEEELALIHARMLSSVAA